MQRGLASNLALANQSLEAEKSLAALPPRGRRYFPEVALNARYTAADGGREINVPVAQLLNPAYQTLNELLVAGGGTPRFPPLADQSFPLLRRASRTRTSHCASRCMRPAWLPAWLRRALAPRR